MKTYNWATYGTGVIANQLAQAMASQGRKLYSVSNRTYAKGVAFAEKYNISKIYDNPEDVFTDTNLIESAGLEIPAAVLLRNELIENGISLSHEVINKDDLVDALCR